MRETHTKLHPSGIIFISSLAKDIDDVISRPYSTESGKRVLSINNLKTIRRLEDTVLSSCS